MLEAAALLCAEGSAPASDCSFRLTCTAAAVPVLWVLLSFPALILTTV